MESEAQNKMAKLVRTQQVAALATMEAGTPFVSMVPYALSVEPAGMLIHISALAAHTKHIQQMPRVALLIHEQETETRNPQTLARVSINGEAVQIPKDSEQYLTAKTAYLNKHPKAKLSFQLDDFGLYLIEPAMVRFVGGFAQAYDLDGQTFAEAITAGEAVG